MRDDANHRRTLTDRNHDPRYPYKGQKAGGRAIAREGFETLSQADTDSYDYPDRPSLTPDAEYDPKRTRQW